MGIAYLQNGGVSATRQSNGPSRRTCPAAISVGWGESAMENNPIRSSGENTLVTIWIEGKLRNISISRGCGRSLPEAARSPVRGAVRRRLPRVRPHAPRRRHRGGQEPAAQYRPGRRDRRDRRRPGSAARMVREPASGGDRRPPQGRPAQGQPPGRNRPPEELSPRFRFATVAGPPIHRKNCVKPAFTRLHPTRG